MSPFVYSHVQEYNFRCQLLKGDIQSTYCSILSLIHDSRINTTDPDDTRLCSERFDR